MANGSSNVYEGKVAVITGGASGIGAALGKALARRGARVMLADRQLDLAEGVAREIGARAAAALVDVRSPASLAEVVARTIGAWSRIDYFFNNAGIGIGGEVDSYTERDWDDVFDVNLRGVTNGIQAIYPTMIRQGSGHIVNTASMAGLVPAPGEASYAASKHAVVGLSKVLRIEAKRHGVRVSVVCPGAIQTPILTGGKYGRIDLGLSKEHIEAIWRRVRPMDPDVFADKVLDALAANEAIIIFPAFWRILWYVERISPRLSMRVWERILNELRDEIETANGPSKVPVRPASSVD
jgi:NADP-dependent 3-hydroxy acid dehydrogenase YdfG